MPFVETNQLQMYYEEHGQGDPLLLIMGITAPGSLWTKHLEYWKTRFRCIVPDNRGIGLSDKPKGPYSTAAMADDYAGLLDALQVKDVRIVGCSMGSTIAQQLALRHADRVRSMVMMCPWARCDRYARGVFQHLISSKARLRPEEFLSYVQLLIFSKGSWDDDVLYAEMLDARRQAAIDPSPQPLYALEAQAFACIQHDVLHELHKIRQSCLVIGGAADIFTPPWMMEEIRACLPNCETHLYEGAGHAFHWERLDDFNPRILNWLLNH
jgi:pimeloyl-ACP methyl ester carboxylesterase